MMQCMMATRVMGMGMIGWVPVIAKKTTRPTEIVQLTLPVMQWGIAVTVQQAMDWPADVTGAQRRVPKVWRLKGQRAQPLEQLHRGTVIGRISKPGRKAAPPQQGEAGGSQAWRRMSYYSSVWG